MEEVLLSREELDLVYYYRGLSIEKQLEILESAESSFNVAKRMEELAGRDVEKHFPNEEAGRA
jgi:hypothetical protein